MLFGLGFEPSQGDLGQLVIIQQDWKTLVALRKKCHNQGGNCHRGWRAASNTTGAGPDDTRLPQGWRQCKGFTVVQTKKKERKNEGDNGGGDMDRGTVASLELAKEKK